MSVVVIILTMWCFVYLIVIELGIEVDLKALNEFVGLMKLHRPPLTGELPLDVYMFNSLYDHIQTLPQNLETLK